MEKIEVSVRLPKDLYDEIQTLLKRSGRDWDFAVREALRLWVLTTDPITGARPPVGVPSPPPHPTCPQCGTPVIIEETPYAEVGFCINCGEVTVERAKIEEYETLLEAYHQALKSLGSKE